MRGTIGTGMSGMMAPLAMANNFHGDYYAGPSGAAIGALQLGNQLGEAFRDMGAASRDRQLRADERTQIEQAQMQDMNNRQAVASAINPLQAAQSSGMGNRDVSRRMALPDSDVQMQVYGLQQQKAQKEQAALLEKQKNFANAYLARGAYKSDPTGEKFAAQFGYNPYEIGDASIISRAEEKEAQRQWQEQMKHEGYTQAQILAGMRGGGGGSSVKAPSGYRTVIDENGEQRLEYVPGGPSDPANKKPDLRPVPTSAVASLTSNFGTLSRIDSALKANEAAPGSTGMWKGMVNEVAPSMMNTIDPKGTAARAATADIGSMIIHDRSGAAVTISEYPRLRPFIPTMFDSDEEKRIKLNQLRAEIAQETRLYADNFSPEMGYKRPDSWNQYLAPTQATSQSAAPSTGGGGGWGGDEPPVPEGYVVMP